MGLSHSTKWSGNPEVLRRCHCSMFRLTGRGEEPERADVALANTVK